MFFRRGKKKQKTEELRRHYRRSPGKKHALGVKLQFEGVAPLAGDLLDVSAGGAALSFPAKHDPDIPERVPCRLVFSSLVHGGEVVVDATVKSRTELDESRRYGFEFYGTDELFAQLDSYYFKFFNRRRAVRVRPALDMKMKMQVHYPDRAVEVVVNDISTQGVGFVLNSVEAIMVQRIVEVGIDFTIPKKQVSIRRDASVRHATDRGNDTLFGLLFGSGPGRGALLEYIEQREHDMARWDNASS